MVAFCSTSYPMSVINNYWNKEKFLISKEKSKIFYEVEFNFPLFYESQYLWKCYLLLYFLLAISIDESKSKINIFPDAQTCHEEGH